jgi:7-carboxy-7-deazaguanine synthase
VALGEIRLVYSVKETFLTLQGEGFHAGRAAVFCRFAGCNLWSGHEKDRSAAACVFCDTDFVGTNGSGGGKFVSAETLAVHVQRTWGERERDRLVVFTGGEPLLQLDAGLIDAMHARGFIIAVETNGTVAPPAGIDWLTVSPKGAAPIRAAAGQELKLVFSQPTALPERFEHLSFEHFFLQPMYGPALAEHSQNAIRYCISNPKWRLSMQIHKIAGFA